MQLDIFEHSRDVMLRNDVLAALKRRDPNAARSAWHALGAEFTDDASLPGLDTLVRALKRRTSVPFADHEAAREARFALQHEIEPVALQWMGPGAAAAWLATLWQGMAQRAARLAFRAESAEEHAAPMLLHGRQWHAAVDAVTGIESWRQIPAPLSWMAEARHRLDGLEAAWPLLAELAWLSPERFGALGTRLGDPALTSLLRKFDAGYEGDGDATDLVWFPAWVLIDRPELAPALVQAQPSRHSAPEQAMRLMLELLRLERQGQHRELIERRKALRGLNPVLFGAYMKTR